MSDDFRKYRMAMTASTDQMIAAMDEEVLAHINAAAREADAAMRTLMAHGVASQGAVAVVVSSVIGNLLALRTDA